MRQSSNQTPPTSEGAPRAAASGAVPARHPDNEAQRIAALNQFGVLDTLPEQSYQDIVKLASMICDVPIALISLIDSDRQWFKARQGLEAEQTPRELAFCAHAILEPGELFQVRDATRDARFSTNPLVTGAPDIRFYAGVPLVTHDGYALGTLCAIDRRPRVLSAAQADGLRALARQVMELLSLRRALGELSQTRTGLAQSELRFGAIVGNLPGFVFRAEVNRPWRVHYASAGVESLTGYPPEFFTVDTRGWQELMLVEDIDRTEAELAAQAAQNLPLRSEYRIRRRDGHVLWVEGRAAHPYRDDAGVLMFDGMVMDIDAPRRAREALIQSEHRFRFLAQSVPEVIWTSGPDGRFDFVSDRVRTQHGFEPAALIGHTWRGAVHPDDVEHATEAWEHCRLTGDPFEVQMRLRAADGSYRGYQCRAVALKDADGRPLKWFGSNTDIEDTLHAKYQAEAAARARSVFLSTMSHEIRTPMNAVLGFAGLLNDTTLTAQQRDFVQAIRTSGDHLLGLINDVLDYSKIESGGLRLELAPFDVRRLVETALDLVSHQAQAKNLELVFTVAPSVPDTSRGDAARVRQVLVNLLGNAVKFTQAGEVSVHLDAVPLADGRTEFRYEVRDTGIGISPEAQERLFVEFSQAEADTGRRFGGTGLGLAISKRIVEAHEGRIEVQSEAGRGSLFRVCIPSSAGTQPQAALPQTLRGRRVLIVDDNAAQIAAMADLVREWGLEPVCERDPQRALERMEKGERCELAIIDQAMPSLDGGELSRRLRASGDLPIILLSTLGAERPQGVAFAAVMSKPVRRSRLHGALVQALQSRPAEVPVEASRPGPAVVAPLSILLAEDNLTNQKLAGLLLRRLGYPSIDIADDGEKALAAVVAKPYDVVLMDLEMPGLDGIEATRRIRAQVPAERQPLIIAMTANVLAEDRERCRAAGMDDYVAKPIDPEQLAGALRRAASRTRAH
ncbi:PAS domain S-box-containing protein [Panacagrimonas perspica]|uniref:histidine kinase n=1 Tax=Panacagrimonas perspica TaxID=381431 RepID=A0A4R7PCN7_9GAMM|nr:response regulator [Panacagrimonas perspica]TDU31000.1 PAS domain S-box-containing protein [Panacagrimonas perspica]THD01851.1 hypothetical protein B1810_17775 [Panacagrimonas perspica]